MMESGDTNDPKVIDAEDTTETVEKLEHTSTPAGSETYSSDQESFQLSDDPSLEKTSSSSRKSSAAPSNAQAYRPPLWAMICPADAVYRLEVIKNGIPLPECTVNLTNDSTSISASDSAGVEELSFCLFGRQPENFYAPFNRLHGQCVVMAHPSISRLHAVLQYGRPPLSIAKTSAAHVDSPGWYLQDLDSTHGTFVNKRRLPSGRFVRIHVGHVIRFGCSTRLYLLSGPDEDTEQESPQSWTELKQAFYARKLAQEQQLNKLTGLTTTQDVDPGCDWGFSAEEPCDDGANFLANIKGAACLSHENLYLDDPKRALRAYFEREGIEPAPEFEFVEAAFGKQHCRIELPLDSGTITAEAIVSGKRKEAIAACALEACRLLDRLGEFDPNKSTLQHDILLIDQFYSHCAWIAFMVHLS
ncbi:unnamed protein product [Echinostoma caproni]|uniref:FHA domain-containing protein n=1 Tax=Echinostoma caproni TaxID=27848 RepID=A0A183B6P2_9TREM|nr:unnamed protein product [Echinostoma caproni]